MLHPHLYSPHLALQCLLGLLLQLFPLSNPEQTLCPHSSSRKAHEPIPASCASIPDKRMSQHHLHEASAVLIFQHLPPQLHLAHLGQTVSSAEKQTTCDVVQHHFNLSSQSHLFAEEISCLSKGCHRHSLTKVNLRTPTLYHISCTHRHALQLVESLGGHCSQTSGQSPALCCVPVNSKPVKCEAPFSAHIPLTDPMWSQQGSQVSLPCITQRSETLLTIRSPTHRIKASGLEKVQDLALLAGRGLVANKPVGTAIPFIPRRSACV